MPRPKAAKASSEESSALSSALSDVEPAVVKSTATSDRNQGTKRKRQVKTEVKEEEVVEEAAPARKSRQRKVVKEEEEKEEVDDDEPSPKKAKRTTKKTVEKTEPVQVKVPRKRKTKEEKEAEAMPLAARTAAHKLFIGAHISSAGGVPNAVTNAVHIGANAFALFLKSQRKWANPALDPTHSANFLSHCKKHHYDQAKHVVPHGSYLVNLAHTDATRTKQAYDSFLDDLKRCEQLGIQLYNFHPGNSVGNDRSEAIAHLANNLNRAHKETSTVVTLLENMAAGGNVIGSTFEDLRDVIALIHDKSRVGVCLDTCHAFAGGYDLRTPEAVQKTFAEFEQTVGIEYLRALHLNDSKAPFSSHRDLHANIGTGFLGLRAFHAIMNDERVHGLPMVLETPIEVRDEDGALQKDAKNKDIEDKGIWAREIKMLESFVAMDVESEEFKTMEEKLQRMGKGERERIEEQVEKREEKAKAKKGKGTNAVKGGKKKGKQVKDEDEDESELSSIGSDDDDEK